MDTHILIHTRIRTYVSVFKKHARIYAYVYTPI